MPNIATTQYLRSLNLNYEPASFSPLPRHLTVEKVTFVRKRIFHPEVPDVKLDYIIEYKDGTADRLSFSEVQPLPEVGEYYERITAVLSGEYLLINPLNYLVWAD